MPNLGDEFHDRRFEGIFIRNPDVDFVCSTLVWSSRRPFKRASQFRDIVSNGVCKDLRSCIGPDIC